MGRIIQIMSLDLNYLKKVNDTFGHEEGDRYIQNAANILETAVGENGETFRIGGDDSELFKTSKWWSDLLNKECGDCCSIDVKEAECYDIAWQEWFESGHEYGLRDKDFLDK